MVSRQSNSAPAYNQDSAVLALERATEAMVNAVDEYELLEEICRIGADVAGYRLVWIGYARPAPTKMVVPMASAGPALPYLENIRISWGDDEYGRGPTGTSIRSGQPVIVNDTDSAPIFEPWRTQAQRFGFRATASLPIMDGNGERIGAIMFYAAQPDAFDPLTVRLLSGLAGNLAHGIIALRMKSAHQRTIRELEESEERYRSLIEMSPDAMLVHSFGTILFANPAAQELFGTQEGESLVGRQMMDLIGPDSRSMALARLAEPPPGPYLGQYHLLRLDGSPFEAEVTALSVTYRDQPGRMITVRDITERTQLHEQMIQTAKLATLGEMAAGLVHELSQPLNIIRMAAEGAIMLMERGKASAEWQAEQFQMIADQSERAAEIINGIRIFSRRDTTPLQVFEAMLAIEGAAEVLAGQMKPDGITITLDRPRGPAPVKGRKVQLEQVIMNLLSNAHHALRDHRALAPKGWQGRIQIDTELESDHLLVRIADNGPGIPEAARARIFEPFFTTKEAGRGTGLGLSVSYSIISDMGGRLQLADSVEGSVFMFRLPLCCQEDMPAPIAPPPCAPAQGAFSQAHILVVDDEPAAASALSHYLRSLGCRVSCAASGEEAWRLFSADPADVVITDLRMPDGQGEDLIANLRDFDPLLPIIIVTGHLGATDRLAENLQDDRCAVLKKPVALGALGELTAKFLQPPDE